MKTRIKCLTCDFEQVFSDYRAAMDARDLHEFEYLHPVVIQHRWGRNRRWLTLIGTLTEKYTRPEDGGTTAEAISR